MVVNKSKAAFRTIAEVAEELGVATHVLRFWETKFPQIKPMKRSGGRRYYRPDDVELSVIFFMKNAIRLKGYRNFLRKRVSKPSSVKKFRKTFLKKRQIRLNLTKKAVSLFLTSGVS